MGLHGIATALTGKSTDSAVFTCNTVRLNDGDRNDYQILAKHSFKREGINLSCSEQVKEVFSELVKTIADVVALQLEEYEDHPDQLRPVPLILGRDSAFKFSLDNLAELVMPNLNQPETLTPLEQSQSLRVAIALNHLIIESGNFTRTRFDNKQEIQERLESNTDQINTRLKELKRQLDCGKLDALYQLISEAEDRARTIAKGYSMVYSRANRHDVLGKMIFCHEGTPWADYHINSDLQEQYPIYSFLSWHPEIKRAFEIEFASEMGISREVYCKPCSEKPSPFFVDVIRSMLVDQAFVQKGLKLEDEIQTDFNIKWREKLANIFLYAGFFNQISALSSAE